VDKTRRDWRPGDAPLSLSDGFGYRPTTGTPPAKTDTQVTQVIARMRPCEHCDGYGQVNSILPGLPPVTCPTCAGMGMVAVPARSSRE
jgi:hypothetical protein